MLLSSPEESLALGARLAELVRPGDVIALSGPLGAGKTSIARGLLAALGLEEEAPSPSFAIVQPYAPPKSAFRCCTSISIEIEEAGEAEELGLDDAREDLAADRRMARAAGR
ncbi:tRNA (adenosine(37)-N6)-threonylcarbamoyltransferase complex ATPase subunit type 1 TsaE [Sphingomonas sp. 7/4-4]|uniref:tRNA (adenosine(37)-N6)-threonylcarbamoyltransferase complex ATPase subunit type 1 TsaE n=1 Tax=Sphingomonas sp. 7/4-4 TaxID=3018446 RepID=UPI00300E0C7E